MMRESKHKHKLEKIKRIKKYVNTFNFAENNFADVPEGFFKVDKSSLSYEESRLYEAIHIQWMSENKDKLIRDVGGYVFGLIIFIVSISGLAMLARGKVINVSSVKAATISAALRVVSVRSDILEDVVESTSSAFINIK